MNSRKQLWLTARLSFAFAALIGLAACGNGPAEPTPSANASKPAKVEIRKTADRFQLFVNGQPFYVKGAGLEFGNQEKLAAHGGNSFRTWRTENGQDSCQAVLDRARKNGLYVTMGLEVARERHGFNYDDSAAVARQLEELKAEVLKYKDHPALIIWSIGNELNLNARNPKVWNAVNDISKMIHQVDPNHLTMTALAGIGKEMIADLKTRAPDLDLIGIQMYADIINLPRYLRESQWDGPYLVTEWGATGHWEVQKTAWGAPIENDSTTKADLYGKRFEAVIRTDTRQCLGSYVFLWGQKQERTPTWYGMFLESGEETATVDVMHKIWNGKEPANRSPKLSGAWLDGKTATGNIRLQAGQRYAAKATVEDPDGDPLAFVWEISEESTDLKDGGDAESKPKSLPGLISDMKRPEIELTAPAKSGAYRLFFYAHDGKGHAAHGNIPFFVESAAPSAPANKP
jgi:hypothetical protein